MREISEKIRTYLFLYGERFVEIVYRGDEWEKFVRFIIDEGCIFSVIGDFPDILCDALYRRKNRTYPKHIDDVDKYEPKEIHYDEFLDDSTHEPSLCRIECDATYIKYRKKWQ